MAALPGPSRLASSDPAVPEQQVEDQDQQENAADADPASVPVSAIPEAAAEQEQQNENDQDQVHSLFSLVRWRGGRLGQLAETHSIHPPVDHDLGMLAICDIAAENTGAAFPQDRHAGLPDRADFGGP
jgi:hypothetical protein